MLFRSDTSYTVGLLQKASSNAETIKLQIEPSRVGSGGFGSCYRCVQRQAQEGSSSIKANDICLKLVCPFTVQYWFDSSSFVSPCKQMLCACVCVEISLNEKQTL